MTPGWESFVFGAANSLHCACMCGPLALAFQGGAGGAVSYHLGRTVSYGAVGVGLGAAGAALGAGQLGSPTAWVAFALAAGLLVLALVGERGAVALPGLGLVLRAAMARGRRLGPAARAGVLGLCTPFLPCGLLWAACAAAAVAGTPAGGGGVMVGFALGSLPLLLLAQVATPRLAARFSPRLLRATQRTAMLLAAALLAWRGLSSWQGEGCCH